MIREIVMKKRLIAAIAVCVCLTGCGGDVPQLLEPLGNEQTTVEVKRGEMYNMSVYNENVVPDVTEVRTPGSGTIQAVNCMLGDTVKKGDVLIQLGAATGEDSSESIDMQIDELNRQHTYNDSIAALDIEIAREELAQLQEGGGSPDDIATQNDVLNSLSNKRAGDEITYQTRLAELQMLKTDGSAVDSQVVAPVNGQVVYMNVGNIGDSVAKDVVVICIAAENTLKIYGDYIYPDIYKAAGESYAFIDGQKVSVTYSMMTDSEASNIVTLGHQLFSTFFFNDKEHVPPLGTYAPIVLKTDVKEDVLYIPDNALYEDVDGYYVYVPGEEEGSRVRKDVEIGDRWDLYAEVKNGLKEGDVVYAK